jgi:hypothetical protein
MTSVDVFQWMCLFENIANRKHHECRQWKPIIKPS